MMQYTRQKRLLSLTVATLSTGFTSIPAISQETPDDSLVQLEEVVVIGIRGSQKAAVDVKRNSDIIVDSIVAEDIGKLPDVTIADSLQRVTGVQIQRTAGEGTSLNIRGMPQVLTTLNGEQFLSPWSITDVGANYSDIPASMISGVDVYKSQSASLAVGGISGVVDLKTRRPRNLDQGWTASVGAEVSQGSITEEDNYNVNGLVGYNGDRFGFTLGGFQTNSNSANYQIREDLRLGFVGQGGDPLDLNNNGDLNDRYLVPGAYGVSAFVMEREREGMSGSFQFDISDSLELTTDVFYTKMNQYDRGVRTQFNGSNSDAYDVLRPGTETSYETTVPAEGDTPARDINSIQVAVVEAPDFQATTRSTQNHTESLNANIELAFDNGGPFTGSVRYIHGDAEKTYENATFQQGTPEWYWVDENNDGIDDPVEPFWVTVDYREEYPTFQFEDDLSSTDRLNLFQAFADGVEQEASLDVARADGTYEFDAAGFTSVEFGVRYGRRDVDNDRFIYMTPTGYYSTWEDPNVPEDLWYQPLPGDYKWQQYPDWNDLAGNAQLGIEPYDELRDMLTSYNDFGPFGGWGDGVAALDPHQLDDLDGFMEFLYPGSERFVDPSRAYSVVEEETSGYIQMNFANDEGLFGVPFEGNFGVQVVETKREVVNALYDQQSVPEQGTYYGGGYPATYGEPQGWQIMYKTLGTETTETSFTDVLPSFNINFFPREDVIVRFGYAETMSRNDLANIGSGESLWYQEYKVYTEDGNQTDENGSYNVVTSPGGGNDQGNPYVDPWRANNYNLSTEWYFGEGGILGASVFLIEVESATQSMQEARAYPDSDGVVRRTANVWTTQNVPASDLQGFELGYKQAFTFLPGVLSNTGIEANYTYSDNDSGSVDLEGNAFPLQSNSEHQANLIVWYQGDKLSSRIAYNWRSDIFQGQAGLNTNEAPISLGNWSEPAGYLDASINYDINDNVTVYLQGINLTETDYRNYSQFEDSFYSLSVQERRLALGLRARL
ncbi:TonB-dependent receptor [Gilvimarinus xylanilyticus]|uniref:TonB-dependent receptor n=1 Tax=Gilvimarinus xylanilyticus TaxID=2944139 RepID=A0A9X2I1I6_9GAMM|nr:TonB-dependent receptor [Gilvimarinus xylanilyticus]MCP8898461.1 TonB-dependent receptor [Gilvimarinus xylanilyticus]